MEKWIETGKIEAKDLGRIYELLSAPLPQEAAQHSKAAKTKKGFDTTGYKPQFFINRMNEVCGLGGWRIHVTAQKLEKVTLGKSGWEAWEAVITAKAEIGNWGPEFFGCLAERTNFGGQRSPAPDDSLKGALSAATSKVLSGFGVGKLSYEGGLDEALRNGESVPGNPPPMEQPPQQRAGNGHKPPPPPPPEKKKAQLIRDLTETEKKAMGVDDLKAAQVKFAALTSDGTGEEVFLAGLKKFQAGSIEDVYVSAIGTVRKVLLVDYAELEERLMELEKEEEK